MTELLRIGADGTKHGVPAPFKNEAHDFEDYLAAHLDLIAPGMKLLARQLDTGRGDRIDILAAEPQPNGEAQPVVVELKNVRADANVLVQCMRYANWLRSNPDSLRLHAKAAGIEVDVTAPKVVLVAPEVDEGALELAGYTSGNLDLEFVEIQRFVIGSDEFFIVNRGRSAPLQPVVATSRQEEWNWERYERDLEIKVETLKQAQALFAEIQKVVADQGWQLIPTFRKWYVPFQRDGSNAIVINFRSRSTFELWIKLPKPPEELGLPSRGADGPKWESNFKFARFNWNLGEPLDWWLPYFDHAIKTVSA